MAHVVHAPTGLAHRGKGFGQQVFVRLAVVQPLPELHRHIAQLGVGLLLPDLFQLVDARHQWLETLELTLVAGAKNLLYQVADHRALLSPGL